MPINFIILYTLLPGLMIAYPLKCSITLCVNLSLCTAQTNIQRLRPLLWQGNTVRLQETSCKNISCPWTLHVFFVFKLRTLGVKVISDQPGQYNTSRMQPPTSSEPIIQRVVCLHNMHYRIPHIQDSAYIYLDELLRNLQRTHAVVIQSHRVCPALDKLKIYGVDNTAGILITQENHDQTFTVLPKLPLYVLSMRLALSDNSNYNLLMKFRCATRVH